MTLPIKGVEAPFSEQATGESEVNPEAPRRTHVLGGDDPYANLAELTYMIVDDEPFNRKVIRESLSFFGVRRIIEAENGIEALVELSKESVDLVLTDYEMPLVSGVDLTRMIRKSQEVRNPTVPVVIISDFSEEYRLCEAVSAGVTEYLIKPFAPDKLLTHVIRALGVSPPA